MSERVVAPGAHIEVRDAVWRVVQVNQTSSGKQAWHVIGLSEIVRDQEAIFLEEYEPEVTVLDPRETRLVTDPTAGHRRSRLYLESKLRRLAPTSPEPEVGRLAALDRLQVALDRSHEVARPRQRRGRGRRRGRAGGGIGSWSGDRSRGRLRRRGGERPGRGTGGRFR